MPSGRSVLEIRLEIYSIELRSLVNLTLYLHVGLKLLREIRRLEGDFNSKIDLEIVVNVR